MLVATDFYSMKKNTICKSVGTFFKKKKKTEEIQHKGEKIV